jgi:hypothetical protein
MFDLLRTFRAGSLGSSIDCRDLDARQFATVAHRAVITLAAPVFKSDDFLVLALFQNFRSHLCSRDQRVSVLYVFSIGKQQYVTKRGSFARFDIEKIDVQRVAFRDAKLPATGSDNCVSHSFPGEKEPAIIPHLRALGKRKRETSAQLYAIALSGARTSSEYKAS